MPMSPLAGQQKSLVFNRELIDGLIQDRMRQLRLERQQQIELEANRAIADDDSVGRFLRVGPTEHVSEDESLGGLPLGRHLPGVEERPEPPRSP